MTRFLIGAAILLQSSMAVASSDLPYERLQSLFESSSAPATLEDFDVWKDSKQHCVIVGSEKSDPLPITIARYDLFIDGKPDGGPLFPGTPGHCERTLIVTTDAPSSFDWYARRMLKDSTITATPTELEVRLEASSTRFRNSYFFRRSGDFVVFMQRFALKAHPETRSYGYCYR